MKGPRPDITNEGCTLGQFPSFRLLPGRLVIGGPHVLFLDPPYCDTRSGPIDDAPRLHRRVVDDIHILPTPPNEVDHLIRPGPERVSSPHGSREPKEVAHFDFLLLRFGLTVLIYDDTGTFSRSDNVEPLVLVAMPVRDGAGVARRQSDKVNARLGQTTPVTEGLHVHEDTGVQRVRAGLPLVSGIRGAYEIRRAGWA